MKLDIDFEVNKKSTGRFLTEGDPFDYNIFKKWFLEAIQDATIICEPYAGRNNLLKYLDTHFHESIEDKQFYSYDVIPCQSDENTFPQSAIIKANTLFDIPCEKDIDLIITNPPYLARNSARRQKLDFPFNHIGKGIKQPQDLYQICIDTCLQHSKYAAMIIPESFITSKYDKSRLEHVISLPGNLFLDTDMPVCLALFGKDEKDEYELYNSNGERIASNNELLEINDIILNVKGDKNIKFNRKDGQIGLHGLDNISQPSIYFCDREEIPEERIKVSSRGLTRIYIPNIDKKPYSIEELINTSNDILKHWRNETNDIFLTAFKGVRKDGKYRRRLSYDIANKILSKAIQQLNEKYNIQ